MPFTKFKPFDDDKSGSWSGKIKPCVHPSHDPPGMIVLPPGEHTYQCPGCGKEVTFTVPERPICEVT